MTDKALPDDETRGPCPHRHVRASCPDCIPDPVMVIGLRGFYVRSFKHDCRGKPRRTRDEALADWDALVSGTFA